MKKFLASLLVLITIIGFFMPTIIEKLFAVHTNSKIILSSSFSSPEILGYAGNIVSAISTALLGGLALYQNEIFQKENDKSQERLNNAVSKLAEANEIIATTNEKLFALEEKNQKIQLLLAQDFIPSLELQKVENIEIALMPTPEENNFEITQDGDIQACVRYASYQNLRRIQFIVEAATKTTLGHYGIIKLDLHLIHPSKARISQLSIRKITLANNSSHIIFNNKDQILPKTSQSNFFIYKLRLICTNDVAQPSFERNGIITVEFLIQTTSGIRYNQVVEFNYTKFSAEKTVNYVFEMY